MAYESFGRFLRLFAGRITVLVLLICGNSILGLLPILIGRWFIDDGIVPRNEERIWLLGGMLALTALALALIALLQNWYAVRLGEDMVLRLREDLFAHLRDQAIGFFQAARGGAIVSRLHGDVVSVQRVVTSTIPSVVGAVATMVTAGVLLVSLEWRLALATMMLVPFMYAITAWFSRSLKAVNRRQMAAYATMDARIAERFSAPGAELVTLYGDAYRDLKAFKEDAGEVRDHAVHQGMLGGALSGFLALTLGVTSAAAYIASGLGVASGALTLGAMVALVTLLARLYSPIVTLAGIRVELVAGLVSFDRVREVMRFPPAVTDADSVGRHPGQAEHGIVFSDVVFEYPAGGTLAPVSLSGERPDAEVARGRVLDGLSLSIAPGEMVGVVGLSGGGKSTLARLLVRLWDVTSGQILINGRPITDISLESLRREIGVLGQEPFLLNDTMRANLLLAKPEASEEELEAACREACIWDTIESSPDRLDTMVGNGGLQLSGGERQRLAIARLLLKSPSIVVLDEATSHLDSSTERALLDTLRPFLKARTCLIITHRLSAAREADTIVVLDGGRVVEQGTHDQLSRVGGRYTRFLRENRALTEQQE
ncbi:ABC transporter ATP-binding protein [Spongiactinospora sp. 9N601]|uniref:ABC transporter ATP-binding protein n=1 Tax=Spongiactinospora sp. 9N601 TaxID=3375149 RepID=UPI003797F78E